MYIVKLIKFILQFSGQIRRNWKIRSKIIQRFQIPIHGFDKVFIRFKSKVPYTVQFFTVNKSLKERKKCLLTETSRLSVTTKWMMTSRRKKKYQRNPITCLAFWNQDTLVTTYSFYCTKSREYLLFDMTCMINIENI